MSFDLAIWHSRKPLSRKTALAIYEQLCEEGISSRLISSPALTTFTKELLTLYPPLDLLTDAEIESSPWADGPHASGDTHLLLSIRWSRAQEVSAQIIELAAKHGLFCFDPQDESGDPTRVRFDRVLRSLTERLAPSAFEFVDDISQLMLRSRDLFRHSIHVYRFPMPSRDDFRIQLAVGSEVLQKWRQDYWKSSPPEGVAQVDLRRLAGNHEIFERNLRREKAFAGLLEIALDLIQAHALPYFATFESMATLTRALLERDIPGMRPSTCLEVALASEHRDAARTIACAQWKRHAEWRDTMDVIRSRGDVRPLPKLTVDWAQVAIDFRLLD